MTEYSDTVFSQEYCLNRLIDDYINYGQIIVAYDFDDTVRPLHQKNDNACSMVRALLRECSRYQKQIDMICYTCRGESDIQSLVIPYLKKEGIRFSKINEQSDTLSADTKATLGSKLLYGIFLEDRAGLQSAYITLTNFLSWLAESLHS